MNATQIGGVTVTPAVNDFGDLYAFEVVNSGSDGVDIFVSDDDEDSTRWRVNATIGPRRRSSAEVRAIAAALKSAADVADALNTRADA